MPISRCPRRTGRIWDDIGKQPYRSARALEPGRERAWASDLICERVVHIERALHLRLKRYHCHCVCFRLDSKIGQIIRALRPAVRVAVAIRLLCLL